MKKYRLEASQVNLDTYTIEVEAISKKEAMKKALATPVEHWYKKNSQNLSGLDLDIVEEELISESELQKLLTV